MHNTPACRAPTHPAGSAGGGLYIVNSDGQNNQPLYNYDGTHPTISPNGATVAYESDDGDIWLTDYEGREERNLTSSPGSVDQDPDWSRNR